jgi:ubiquinone/menaquinone biosynthesis C-methylase UbiE
MSMIRKWWPKVVSEAEWRSRLSKFYQERDDYHRMTAGDGQKVFHPQVLMLLKLLKPQGRYVEIGCGSGLICHQVGKVANVHGFDVAPIAIAKASQRYASERVVFDVADASACPQPSNSVDGVYCFEVLEHLYDPLKAIREMVRIAKPGGFILVSCPNRFSLDLHLRKRPMVRFAEIILSLVRYYGDRKTGRVFVAFAPDLDADPIYPDCDAVTSLVPCNIQRFLKQLGCSMEVLDTYYMCAEKVDASGHQNKRLHRFARYPLLKWYGDHVLILARKQKL